MEGCAGPDQRNQLRRVDCPPPVLSRFDELERHRQPGHPRPRPLGHLRPVPHGRERRLDRIGRAQMHPIPGRVVVELPQHISSSRIFATALGNLVPWSMAAHRIPSRASQRDLLPLGQTQAATLQPRPRRGRTPPASTSTRRPLRQLVSITSTASMMKPPSDMACQNCCKRSRRTKIEYSATDNTQPVGVALTARTQGSLRER